MLTQAPLPSWSDLVLALVRRVPPGVDQTERGVSWMALPFGMVAGSHSIVAKELLAWDSANGMGAGFFLQLVFAGP